MTNLINVETQDRCAYVSIHAANKDVAKKLGFRWCKGKGDHGKGMWYIREDAETDDKVAAAEQLEPRARGVYYTPTIRFDQPAGVSSAWKDHEESKNTAKKLLAERKAAAKAAGRPASSVGVDDLSRRFVKREETLAERMERERLEALKKTD